MKDPSKTNQELIEKISALKQRIGELEKSETEIKHTEETLRKSEDRYRKITEGLSDYLYTVRICNGQAMETTHSPSCAAVTGYTEEEFANDPHLWFHMIFAEDRDRVLEHVRDILAGRDIHSFYHRILRKDGQIRWVSDTPILHTDSQGRLEFYEGVVKDITELKQAEEARSDSEKKYRTLVENAAVGIAEVEAGTGRFLSVNQMFCEMVGRTEEEMRRITFHAITHPEDLNLHPVLSRRMYGGEIDHYSLEKRYLRKDGGIIWVHITISRLWKLGETQRSSITIVHDITERKRMEEEKENLEIQNRQLQKSESLSRMAGAIAHHFNNQLGAVIGNLEMAIDDLPQGEKGVESLTKAMRAADKAAEMSGLMLTYLGQSLGSKEPVDLPEICRKSLPMFQTVIPGNVALKAELPFLRTIISANTNQIQQVLINLVTNACKAIGEGMGTLRLTVKTVSPAEIPSLYRYPIDWQPQDNAYACLEVADTGHGVEHRDIENLFDPFFTSKFSGRGLGLSIVMGIVKAHGGAVTVESEQGKGSIFRVFIPTCSEEVPKRPQRTAQVQEFSEGGTVLLVEDEEMVRNMTADMLKRLGFTVLEAKDGVDAVEVFQQYRDEIRLVLSDLTMPRMNGWETLTALRKLVPDIPVILASGYDEARVMEGDHPEWPQVFLGKPYKLKELGSAISRALTISNGDHEHALF
jgi:two-component system cell cycle sensor histidine kinase/response regulator CckA